MPGLGGQIKELWRSVGKAREWKHPQAPTVRLLFKDEGATPAVLQFLRDTEVERMVTLPPREKGEEWEGLAYFAPPICNNYSYALQTPDTYCPTPPRGEHYTRTESKRINRLHFWAGFYSMGSICSTGVYGVCRASLIHTHRQYAVAYVLSLLLSHFYLF